MILVLALDAASPVLLRAWGADGTLPNIGRLLREGLSGDAKSFDGLYHGATWPSFMTGRLPGEHGIYWLLQAHVGGYDQHRLTPEQVGRFPALWDVLAGAGRRLAVFDVPYDRPRPSFPGQQTLEWYSHDPLFGFQSAPPGLARDIERIEGRHPAPPSCDAIRRDARACRRFIDQLTTGAAQRSRIVRRLFAGRPLDFAIAVFAETHCAGHQLWHLHDAGHPGHDRELVERTGDGLREVYVAVDRAVGEILDALAGPDTTVVLLDLHGMSYMAGAGAMLPLALERLGHVTRVPPPPPPSLAKRTIGPLWRALPDGFRNALTPLKRAVMGPPPPPTIPGVLRAQFVPEQSRCFWVNLGTSVSGIRFNVVGRETRGVLPPGEVESFAAALIEELRSLRDADTGATLTESIRWTRDVYPGVGATELPDLLIDWDLSRPLGSAGVGNGEGGFRRVTGPGLGTLEWQNRNCRSGEHRNEGLFVARGPGISPGRLDRVVSLVDYAPTFARMCGVEMKCDGRPIEEIAGPAATG